MGPPPGARPAGGTHKRPRDDTIDLDNEKVDFKKVPPYDPLKEEAPNSVTLSKEWATLVSGRAYIHKLVTTPFKNSPHSDKLTKALEELATATLVNAQQEEIIIRVGGNMGCGKSTTLNSLFSVGSIAREGCEGRSVTLASNIFAASKPGQKEPFLAEVFFFNTKERREILTGYLRDHFLIRHGHDDEGEAGRSNDTSEENVAIENEVETCFFSLFRNHQKCRSLEDVRAFLEDAESEDDYKIISQVCDWTDQLVREATGSDNSVIVTASTPGDLTARLTRYSTQVDAEDGTSEPYLTPMVSLIKFHFDDPLTKHGMTFLDTPGLSDVNKTRRLSALQYSRKKTHSLVVSDILRAQDDFSIPAEVKAMNALGPDRVVIITPKSEVIGTTIPPGSKRDKDLVRHLKRIIGEREDQLARIEDDLAACDDDEDDQLSARLSKDRRKMAILVKRADNAEKAQRIKMRNENTKAELQKKLQHVSRSTRPVPIFSISNWIYLDHLGGFNPNATPVLSVEETQIPQVRRTISTFQNEARLREILHAQNVTIPGFLNRLLLYTSRSPVERKADLEVHVFKPLKKYRPIIEIVSKQLMERLQHIVLNPIRREEDSWTKEASSLCTKWESEFTTPKFLALMNKHGHRKGVGKSRAVDMSAELVNIASLKIERMFSKAMNNQISFEQMMVSALEDLFGSMLRGLRDDENFAFVDSDVFLAHLGNEQPRLRQSVRSTAQRIQDGMTIVSSKASFVTDDAYVVVAMQPIYDQVRMIKNQKGVKTKAPPGGYPKKRKTTFTHECTRPNGIWASVCHGIEHDLSDLIKEEVKNLTTEVGDIFKGCQEAFNLRCDARAVSGPMEKKLQEELRAQVELALDYHRGAMQRAADSLYRDFH